MEFRSSNHSHQPDIGAYNGGPERDATPRDQGPTWFASFGRPVAGIVVTFDVANLHECTMSSATRPGQGFFFATYDLLSAPRNNVTVTIGNTLYKPRAPGASIGGSETVQLQQAVIQVAEYPVTPSGFVPTDVLTFPAVLYAENAKGLGYPVGVQAELTHTGSPDQFPRDPGYIGPLSAASARAPGGKPHLH